MKLSLQIIILAVLLWQIRSQNEDSITCPENMSLFRSDENSTDATCDCEEFYLYYAATNSCHEAYKQGPCLPENYLVLPPGENLARCEKNPCLEDGLVPFEGSCARLKEPCGDNKDNKDNKDKNLQKYLKADKNDFQIRCSELKFTLSDRVNAPIKECSKGSRRNALGICKRVLIQQ